MYLQVVNDLEVLVCLFQSGKLTIEKIGAFKASVIGLLLTRDDEFQKTLDVLRGYAQVHDEQAQEINLMRTTLGWIKSKYELY